MNLPEHLRSLEPAQPRNRPFERVSFSRQFLIVGAVVLLAGMLVLGNWLARQIENSAVNRTAAIAAVYVESMLTPQLQSWRGREIVDGETQAALDELFVKGPLRRKVLSFKLWDRNGRIAYSSDASQIGLRFPVDSALASAFDGRVQSRISDLEDADNLREQMRWPQLLEVYVPLRGVPGAEIIGVAEFYHSTESLGRDIHTAQQKSWLLVGASTLAIFLALYGLVRRANNTILEQQRDLHQQLHQLRTLLADNDLMRERLRAAGANTTALNERLLQRVAADLHDGPAQAIALVKMRFDEFVDNCQGCAAAGADPRADLTSMREAVHSSLRDLRNIASGLVIPGIAELTLAATASRAAHDFERLSGRSVDIRLDELPDEAPLAVKITLYRVIRESLSNSWKHARANTLSVHARVSDGRMLVSVADDGTGFDPGEAAASARLGLAFMRERVRLLGGVFVLNAAPGRGTTINVDLPLQMEDAVHA